MATIIRTEVSRQRSSRADGRVLPPLSLAIAALASVVGCGGDEDAATVPDFQGAPPQVAPGETAAGEPQQPATPDQPVSTAPETPIDPSAPGNEGPPEVDSLDPNGPGDEASAGGEPVAPEVPGAPEGPVAPEAPGGALTTFAEDPGVACAVGAMPAANALTPSAGLPDPFLSL